MKNNRKFLCDILKQLNAQLQNKVKPFKVKFYLLKEKAILTSGDSFGEYALISNKERNATVYARSP
jgi:CRP-like cAMP-binding protein